MYTQLSESAAGALRPILKNLRIIVLAMAMGVLAFGAFSVFQNAGKPQLLGQKLSLPLLIFGLVALPAGLLVPAFVFRSGMNRLAGMPPAARPKDEVNLAGAILQQIQATTIIACAIWEGGAFASLLQYMTAVELVHLIVAGVLLLAILTRFPWPGRCEQIIASEMRRMNEEQGLQRTP